MKRFAFACLSGLAVAWFTCLCGGTAASAGDNIYPDPSFEQTGVRGVSRTGKRAGNLKIAGHIYWKAIGGRITVEPFATYRATAYVRTQPGGGKLYGLYCYSWNSFDWHWAKSVTLGRIPEWKKIEITFVSPNDYVLLHPLAAIRGERCEAWIDDIVVERVRSPEETMKAILAKPPTGRQDVALRVRYHLSKGDVARARALAANSTDYVRADTACLLAQRTKDRGERLRLVSEMARYGGLGYSNGETRFRELTADATPDEKEALFLDALKASGFGAAAARGYAAHVSREIDEAVREGTCRRGEQRLDGIAGRLTSLLRRCPPDAAGREELDKMKEKLALARRDMAKRRAELGKCVIRIGRKPVRPASHAIVVPEEPTPQETFAAGDLQAQLEKLTGKEIPIVTDGKLGRRTPIVVGRCHATLRKLRVRINFEKLGLEGIVIRTRGPALILAGGTRGVLYAVYSFLEDYCGCRWFTPDCTVMPKSGTFNVGRLNVRHTPPLEYRSTDYPCSRDADWAVRNKINGTQTRLDRKRGGKISYSHFVHTFNSILNPDEHFATHPEYFSMIDGQRRSGRTQLCLTNPEVLEIAKETVRRWIRKAPNATIFSVSQNDWRNYCRCPKCAAVAEEEGSEAGPLIYFVNAIARDIAGDFPDKLISTLAYQYTRTPVRHVRPEPNVCVRLCTIECDFAHPLDKSTHPQNVKFVEDIQGWNKLCNRLYIWDYIIDYSHCVMPWPNLYALKPNIRFFIENGVKGLYEEACYFTKGSEFAELRTWIVAKTMWNPDYDTDRAIDEFLSAFYGAAAKPIRDYINLMHKPVLEDPEMHITIRTAPTAPYLNERNVREAVRLFDKAEEAVRDDRVLLHRVQVARLPIMYVRIVTGKAGFREEGDALVPAKGADLRGIVERFEKIARKEGLTRIRENRRTGELDTWLRSLNIKDRRLPILRLESDAFEVAVIPNAGGRIWKMVHRPSGREILKRYRDGDGDEIPDSGGYEEYSEGGYRSPGWNEAYRVVEKSRGSVTLEAELPNRLRLTRIITLDPGKPVVTIDSTLTNVGNAPRKACLRSHPSFAVSDVQKAVVRFPTALGGADGSEQVRSLAFRGDPKQEKDEFLAGDAMPAGEWTLVDQVTGLGVRCRFDPEAVGRCLLNRSGKDRRVNLELYAKERTLAPGESQRLRHSIEVVPGRVTTAAE